MKNKRPNRPKTWIDFHTHCLPGLDDGAKDVVTTLRMLRMLHSQGVRKVAATPHFNANLETLSSFLHRQRSAHTAFLRHPRACEFPPLLLGAEVRLTTDLADLDLRPLCLTGTNLLLLELPEQPYQNWMPEEIQNIVYTLNVVPVLAHIERYLPLYSKQQYDSILSFAPMVFQVSPDAFSNRSSFRLIRRLVRDGRTLVLGSDCHNLTSRPPNFSEILQLEEKNSVSSILTYIHRCTLRVERTSRF